MKQLTHAEKQQLEAKIGKEKERQRVLRMNPNTSTKLVETDFIFINYLWNYSFLGIILYLLVRCVMRLLEWQDFAYDEYGTLVIVLMLLFNHIAYNLTKTGWKSRVMKTVARIWIVFGLVYIFWVLR